MPRCNRYILRVDVSKDRRNRGNNSKFTDFDRTLYIRRPQVHTRRGFSLKMKLKRFTVFFVNKTFKITWFVAHELRCRVSTIQVLNQFQTNRIFLMSCSNWTTAKSIRNLTLQIKYVFFYKRSYSYSERESLVLQTNVPKMPAVFVDCIFITEFPKLKSVPRNCRYICERLWSLDCIFNFVVAFSSRIDKRFQRLFYCHNSWKQLQS